MQPDSLMLESIIPSRQLPTRSHNSSILAVCTACSLRISLVSRRIPLTEPSIFFFKPLSLFFWRQIFAFIDLRTFSGSRGKIPGLENADLMFDAVSERSRAVEKRRQKLKTWIYSTARHRLRKWRLLVMDVITLFRRNDADLHVTGYAWGYTKYSRCTMNTDVKHSVLRLGFADKVRLMNKSVCKPRTPIVTWSATD